MIAWKPCLQPLTADLILLDDINNTVLTSASVSRLENDNIHHTTPPSGSATAPHSSMYEIIETDFDINEKKNKKSITSPANREKWTNVQRSYVGKAKHPMDLNELTEYVRKFHHLETRANKSSNIAFRVLQGR